MLRISICLCTLFPLASGQALAQTEYEERCEVSAAVALPDGTFLVVDDETDAATLYLPGDPQPNGAVPLDVPPVGKVTNLEGAALAPDGTLWLMTGHDPNRDNEDKPQRKLVIALRQQQGGWSVVGAFRDLRAVVDGAIGPDGTPLLAGLSVDAGGASTANFEGLAVAPDGALLVGLREPLVGGKAVVVAVPDPLVRAGLEAGSPAPVTAVTLDLGGRAIRSLEADPRGGFVIVGGGSKDGGALAPLLYRWDGTAAPTEVGSASIGSTQAIAEAAFFWPDGRLTLLGDNGDHGGPGGSTCKDGEGTYRHWFPSLDIGP